jgi:hypothetical protein
MTLLGNDNETLAVGSKPEPQRDQWKRAMLIGPDGKRQPYTRVSTIAKSLDDQSTLINYNMRLCAVGLTRRKDLHDVVKMLRDPEGSDKRELRRLVEDAADAGGQGEKANYGTARHKAIERIALGESVSSLDMPDDMLRDVMAILEELKRCGFEIVPEWCETHGVKEAFDYNGLGVSGTFDFVLRRISDGKLFGADLKTGQEVKYANLAWSVQLGIYVNFDSVYDVATDQRSPMPDLDKVSGFTVWAPFGQGRCQLVQLDVANGFLYAHDAVRVRGARAHGKVDVGRDGSLLFFYEPVAQEVLALAGPPAPAVSVATGAPSEPQAVPTQPLLSLVRSDGPVAPPVPDQPTIDSETKRAYHLKQRLRVASDAYRQAVQIWWVEWNERAGAPIPPLNDERHHHSTYELDVITAWCDEAEAQLQETFTADPTVVAAKAVAKAFPGTMDEGEAVDDATLTTLSANLGLWCQPSYLGLLQSWREEAMRLGHDFGVKECPTTRRVALYELGARLCNQLQGDVNNIDMAWAVLVTALKLDSVPDVPFGMAFSLLTIEQIEEALGVVSQIEKNELALYFPEGKAPFWGI